NPALGVFQSDRATEPAVTDSVLRAFANVTGQALTYTCAPPGSGIRMGLDRDGDGVFDRDELDAGSDPADPYDPPGACAGDCDHDGTVTVDEIINGVTIALGGVSLTRCQSLDTNGDGQVDVGELIKAVAAALTSCAAAS